MRIYTKGDDQRASTTFIGKKKKKRAQIFQNTEGQDSENLNDDSDEKLYEISGNELTFLDNL